MDKVEFVIQETVNTARDLYETLRELRKMGYDVPNDNAFFVYTEMSRFYTEQFGHKPEYTE